MLSAREISRRSIREKNDDDSSDLINSEDPKVSRDRIYVCQVPSIKNNVALIATHTATGHVVTRPSMTTCVILKLRRMNVSVEFPTHQARIPTVPIAT